MTSIQTVREFWDKRPCNIRHSKAELGTKQYFEEVEARKYFVEPHIPGFAEFAKWTGKKVLEVGCGIGTDSIGFARAGAELTAVELSAKSLEMAKRRFEVFGLKGRFFEGNAEELDKVLPKEMEGSFDLIYSFGVLHHTPNPKIAFEKIHQFLKPGGEVRVMLYSSISTKNLMIALKLAEPEAQAGCPVAFTYTRKDLNDLLQGFEIIEVKKDHIFPFRIKDYVEYRYVWRYPWRLLPRPLFHFVEKLLGWHLLIKMKLRSPSK